MKKKSMKPMNEATSGYRRCGVHRHGTTADCFPCTKFKLFHRCAKFCWEFLPIDYVVVQSNWWLWMASRHGDDPKGQTSWLCFLFHPTSSCQDHIHMTSIMGPWGSAHSAVLHYSLHWIRRRTVKNTWKYNMNILDILQLEFNMSSTVLFPILKLLM